MGPIPGTVQSRLPGNRVILDPVERKQLMRIGVENRETSDTLPEAKVLVERWRQEYDHVRPHSALGYRAPASEAIQPWPSGLAAPRLQTRAACATNITIGAKTGGRLSYGK